MTTRDIIMLVVSFVTVGAIVLGSQHLHKRGVSLLFTRKMVHVLVGCWIIPAMLLFETSWAAAIFPIVAIFGNAISHFTGMIGAIELKGEKPNYGTILYPASFAFVVLWFFPEYNSYWYAGMLGILIMTFGDTAAGVWGRKFGVGKYTIMDETRTIEGSLAMLIVSFAVSWIVLGVFNLTGLAPLANLIISLLVAALATALEAICIRGTDNIIVPIGTAFFAVWLLSTATPA